MKFLLPLYYRREHEIYNIIKENDFDFLFHGIVGRSGNFYEKIITGVGSIFIMQTHLSWWICEDKIESRIVDGLDIGCIEKSLRSKQREIVDFANSYRDKFEITGNVFYMTLVVGSTYVNFDIDPTQADQMTLFKECDCLTSLVLELASREPFQG